MNVAVIYILPHVNLVRYLPLAQRFCSTLSQYPAGIPFDLHVVVNGSVSVEAIHKQPFVNLNAQFKVGNNVGRDIGAYQQFASQHEAAYDLMVCLGAPVHFCCSGWLDRMVESYCAEGPGLYGSYGFHQPKLHIRTTNFWIPPNLFNAYPHQVHDGNRYAFEHGPESLTIWTLSMGYPCFVTTRTEMIPPVRWRHICKDEALLLDQHTDRMGWG